jgi:cytidylate kinase
LSHRAFIRNSFSADIDDPRSFDLVINTELRDVED